MKKITLVLALILLLFVLNGCGASKEAVTAGSAELGKQDSGNGQSTIQKDMQQDSKAGIEQKIIREAQLILLVPDVNKTAEELEQLSSKNGGYVENAHIWQGNGSMQGQLTLRVPVGSFESFLPKVEALGQVKSKNLSGKNVTEEYYDTDARKKNLERQENRYLELLKEAKSVKDMLEIENELSRVRGEIEALQTHLKVLDNLSDLATINVDLEAPRNISTGATIKEPMNERIKAAWLRGINGMANLVEGFVVLLVMLLPFSPLFAVAGYAGYRLYKKRKSSKDS